MPGVTEPSDTRAKVVRSVYGMDASIGSFGSLDQLMWISEQVRGTRREVFPRVLHPAVGDDPGEPIAASLALTEATSSTTLAKGHGPGV